MIASSTKPKSCAGSVQDRAASHARCHVSSGERIRRCLLGIYRRGAKSEASIHPFALLSNWILGQCAGWIIGLELRIYLDGLSAKEVGSADRPYCRPSTTYNSERIRK